MKQFFVLTLFPEMIEQTLSHSIMGRAQKEGHISVEAVNIRDFTLNKHKHVDDYPYGGGAGLVMQGQPIYDAYQSLMPRAEGARVVFMTPQGRPFTQRIAEELAQEENLVFLCGHYEGIDERLIEEIVTDEISLGDFVLTGGELAAITIIDAVSRLVPGVLGKEESFEDESFSDGLLEYPQYTRPPVFMGREVPEVLLSGHHGNVAKWRREQALLRTAKKRPDLLKTAELTKKDLKFLQEQGIDYEKYKKTLWGLFLFLIWKLGMREHDTEGDLCHFFLAFLHIVLQPLDIQIIQSTGIGIGFTASGKFCIGRQHVQIHIFIQSVQQDGREVGIMQTKGKAAVVAKKTKSIQQLLIAMVFSQIAPFFPFDTETAHNGLQIFFQNVLFGSKAAVITHAGDPRFFC